MRQRFPACVLCAFTLAAVPALAGTANVQFTNAERFSDAGNTRWDEKHNLQILAAHLQALARQQLPDGQTLSVEVLDVDLAGESRPRRGGDWVRVTRGMADWPRMQLRYTLQGPDGQTLRRGEENLSDPVYQQRGWAAGDSDPLRYEKRMLDDWFRKTFSETRARGD